MRVLIVEDDVRIARLVERALRDGGDVPRVAPDGAQGLALAQREEWDVIVLDVMLPRVDGLEVCRRIRGSGSRVPVLLLTARDAVADRVVGLDTGADDYLTKPFATEELLARVRALGRRREAKAEEPIAVGDLVLDVERHEARRGDRVIELSSREFRLLDLLMRNPGRVLTREQILDRVWGRDAEVTPNAVETYVHYLRDKIDRDTERPLIRTVRGVGYALRP